MPYSTLPPTIVACAYDQAGSDKSDPEPEPRSMDAEATDPHAFLANLNVSPPVVLVGTPSEQFLLGYPCTSILIQLQVSCLSIRQMKMTLCSIQRSTAG